MADSYRGIRIEKTVSTQLGYATETGQRGKGRKISGYLVHIPDQAHPKFVDTQRQARAYIDNYYPGEGMIE
jgi:hypothetical protein